MLLPLLAALCSASLPDSAFTFQASAQPLPKLVAALAAKTGESLTVSPELARQIAFMDVTNASQADAFERLASACGGKWQNNHGRQVLVLDSPRRAAIETEAFNHRIAIIQAELKQMEERIYPKVKATEQAQAEFTEGYGRDPFALEILKSLGPRQLATIGPEDRIVLSTQPLARQVAFDNSADIIANYISRKNRRTELQVESLRRSYREEGRDFDTEPRSQRYRNQLKPITSWQKANVILDRDFGIDGIEIQVQLVVYDANGEVISVEADLLSPLDGDTDADSAPAQKAVFAGLHLGPFATDLGQYLAKTFQSYTYAMHAEVGTMNDLRSRVEARLLKPEQVDPLAYSADYVEKLAEHEGRNIVGTLPDSFVSFLPVYVGETTAAKLLADLKARQDVLVRDEKGWLTVSPASFKQSVMARNKLTTLAARLKTVEEPSIDVQASLASEGVGDPLKDAICQLTLLLDPTTSDQMSNMDWDFLRIYALFTPEQRLKLKQTGRLAYADLSADQLEALDKYAYGSISDDGDHRGNLMLEEQPKSGDPDAPSGLQFRRPNDYRSEVTEVAPNGLPVNGYLAVDETMEDGIEPCYQNRPDMINSGFYQGDMDSALEQLAGELVASGLPRRHSDSPPPLRIDRVRIGKQHGLRFRLHFSNDVIHLSTLTENLFEPGSNYALNALPDDLQKKFAQVMAKVRKELMDQMADGNGDGGGGVP